jgi:hypothetical protein
MSRPPRIPVQADPLRVDAIRPDTPLRLDVAARVAYPDGSMTASGLRREAKRGRLVIERTAGKDYTTLAAIERMRELCRVKVEVRTSGCTRSVATLPAASPTPPSGTSRTVDVARARSALNTTLQELNVRFSSTSTANTKPAPDARRVIPLKSR